jgi:hypothetical protein
MTNYRPSSLAAGIEASISQWLAGFAAENPAFEAIDRGEPGEPEPRWYVRLRGEEKDHITIWFTLGQRTLRYEAYVMPAPAEHVAEVYELALRRNDRLVGAHFAIGVEDALFLRGELPLTWLDRGRARPGHRLALQLHRAGVPVADPAGLRQPLPGLRSASGRTSARVQVTHALEVRSGRRGRRVRPFMSRESAVW